MTFKQLVSVYFVALAVFLLADVAWISLIARDFYRKHLGSIISPRVRWAAAVMFYLVYIVGLLVFVIRPAIVGGAPLDALLYGALFGLISYATYDLSNLATIKEWPLIVTIVDLAWGVLLGGAVSFLSFCLGRWIVMK